jgi:hypothetical protein
MCDDEDYAVAVTGHHWASAVSIQCDDNDTMDPQSSFLLLLRQYERNTKMKWSL